MHLFVVRRRGIAGTPNELDAALTRLRCFEDAPFANPVRARWLHSYALRERDRRFGLACVLEAPSAEAVRDHAAATRLPADEVLLATRLLYERRFAPTQVFLVRRPHGWRDAAHFAQTTDAARRACDGEMAREAVWLHSYAVQEDDGAAGSLCLYQATGPRALLDHAARARLPIGEITPVLGRIVHRLQQASP